MFKSYKYFCPKCDEQLSDHNHVSFHILEDGKFKTSIKLNPKPGEYDYLCESSVQLNMGERLNFHCPACNENLQSEQFFDFVSINMKPTERIVFEVLFDRTCGQHATYVMTEDMVEKHGSHPKDLI
jgi:hypothetical protein